MLLRRRELIVKSAVGIATMFTGALSRTAQARDLDFEVLGEFPIIKQVGDTCWATTGTMMYNWKTKSHVSVDELMKAAGNPYAALYQQKTTMPVQNAAHFFSFLGLRPKPPASYPPTTIDNILRTSGLIWATTLTSSEKCKALLHARIIRGIHGPGNVAATEITVVDPATGIQSPVLMSDFYQQFEAYAREENKCDPSEPLAPQLLTF